MKTELGLMLPGGKTGILLLHDVGGSAAELRSCATAFARGGFTVSCPQLIGLGDAASSGQGSAGMLVSEAEQALARLKARCDRIVVVGIEYGAMLALELARHNAESVQAAVLVEPRAWLPSLPVTIPAALSGKINQFWLATLMGLVERARRGQAAPAPAPSGLLPAASGSTMPAAGTLKSIGKLLDSVHAGLPSIKQPVLLIHRQSNARLGQDGSFLLQRRLGGRVESVMLDRTAATSVENPERLVDRIERFVAMLIEEIETRRGNELRRKQVAANRNSAA